MTLDPDRLLDPTGWQILRELEANGRVSFAELGRRVGLSLPAVAERVRRMEDAGIITGYQVRLDPTKVGRPISAFVRIRLHDNITCERLEQLLADLPEVLECHNLTGDDCAIVRVAVPSVPDLEKVIQQLKGFGQTTTSIVLSSFAYKGLAPTSDQTAEDGRQTANGEFVRQGVR